MNDLIYRGAVIEVIQDVPISSGSTKALLLRRVKEIPAEKEGEWVWFGINKLYCLDCGQTVFERYPFCPNCGRKMNMEVIKKCER